MVRVLQQNAVPRKAFQQWVANQQKAERNQHKEALKGLLPGQAVDFLSGLNQFEKSIKGSMGEARVFLNTFLFLPDSWVLFNDVFLQPAPGQFAQIDHLLISPVGVFIVETKAWKGAFVGHRDTWQRQDSLKGWMSCSSPTQQNLRHAKLFWQWLAPILPFQSPAHSELWIKPIVVMTQARFLRTQECAMPVLWGTSRLIEYLASQKKLYLINKQVDQIADLVTNTHQSTATPVPVSQSATSQATVANCPKMPTRTCYKCQGKNLEIQYGYSYYFKCLQCEASSRIQTTCSACGKAQRIRKDKQQFLAECSNCQTSQLFFINGSSS